MNWDDYKQHIALQRIKEAFESFGDSAQKLEKINSDFLKKELHIQETKEELYRMAYYDTLTKCYNRNRLEKIRSYLDKHNFSVIIVDLDNFKEYNTVYGHLGGDKRLQQVANFLNEHFQMVFRLGGDEFLIINSPKSPNYIKQILELMENISFGIYVKDTYESLGDAMHKADLLMYKTKNKKKKSIRRQNRYGF